MQRQIPLKICQLEVYDSRARFRVLAAGRRFGKTYLAIAEIIRAAAAKSGSLIWYLAPTYRQAKRIAWHRLKNATRPYWDQPPSETAMTIYLFGSTVAVLGADKPDSLRGDGLDFVVFDETASMKSECWTDVVLPALADREGGALFIGTPQGRNHFYQRFEEAREDEEWASFQFKTSQGGNVSERELARAARRLDPATYRREFEADFEAVAQHRVYYTFDRSRHVAPVEFVPGVPLVWTLDFNVNPMCALLIQKVDDIVRVLAEIVIPTFGTTDKACQRFFVDTVGYAAKGLLKVEIYGDAAGSQHRTSGAASDWDIVRKSFESWRGKYSPVFKMPAANPPVRDRVNSVNSRLCNVLGESRVLVDPGCRELIKDLEEVTWKLDSLGQVTSEIDKTKSARTHLSDALGYYLGQIYKLRGVVGERGTGRII